MPNLKKKSEKYALCRSQIDDDSTCRPTYRGRDRNKFCIPNVDVSNFLNLHSEDDHDAFCLSYVFTYRDFNKGTLGLAWVASPAGQSAWRAGRSTALFWNLVCLIINNPH